MMMATVQDTNDKLEECSCLLNRVRSALLKGEDREAYHGLTSCVAELGLARLYVAESEAPDPAASKAEGKLNVARIYLSDAIDCLLGRPHRVYKDGAMVDDSPTREWAMQQVAACRVAVLEADNILAADLVSQAPLSTHLRLLEAQNNIEDYPAPHYEAGHDE